MTIFVRPNIKIPISRIQLTIFLQHQRFVLFYFGRSMKLKRERKDGKGLLTSHTLNNTSKFRHPLLSVDNI